MAERSDEQCARLYSDFLAAVVQGEASADRMLREHPWLLEHPDALGETALHYLAVENYRHAVRYLLSRGANPDPRSRLGNSPLQECTTLCDDFDYRVVVELLLAAGADPCSASESLPCAWHHVCCANHEKLDYLFKAIPPPADHHETCDIFAMTGILGPPRF
jgi:ankyrin repeat protein